LVVILKPARAVRYLGTKTDAQLYVGNPAKKLFP
jgi:hypothetical protein